MIPFLIQLILRAMQRAALTAQNKSVCGNAATDFIKEQFAAYNITIVKAKRAINSNAAKRGQVDEVVVRNYE